MFEGIVSLTVLGGVLLFVEVFLPGMVAGVVGALLLLSAIVLSYLYYGADAGGWMLGSVLVFSMALFFWWMRTFFQSRLGRKWLLQSAVPTEPAPESSLLMARGKALTALRPAGVALLDGVRVDVLAESELIENGTDVEVVRVEGRKVVVRKA